MFTLGGGTKIYLATGVTDLSRSFSLYTIIQHRLGFAQPLNGDIFGFINQRHNADIVDSPSAVAYAKPRSRLAIISELSACRDKALWALASEFANN